jgi:phage baseplate assembly protein W
MDIGLLRNIKVTNLRDEISFRIGSNPPVFEGLNKLVQIFLITLITEAGTDAMDREHGAGLSSILTSNFSPNDTSAMESRVSTIFAEAERQIIAEQDGLSIPESETLQRATVLKVSVIPATLEVAIEFAIDNVLGQRAFVRI